MSDLQALRIRVLPSDPPPTVSQLTLRNPDGHRGVSSSIDPELLEEFCLAEGSRALFGELQRPIEPWIALQLARTDEDLLRREFERLTRLKQAGRAVFVGGLIADALDRIYLLMSRRARDLRAVVAASGVPLDPAHLELVLALLLRDGASTPLPGEIRLKADEAHLYLNASSQGPAGLVQELPHGVDADLLQDLRRTEAFVHALASVRPKPELWEVFSLAVRGECDLHQTSPGVRAPAEFDVLYSALVELRLKKALLARALGQYVAGLPIGHYSRDTTDLAFAFIMASPEGCSRARQWMDSPEQFKREAAIRVEGVIARAQNYLTALRATA
jgi:hypothetical protein